MDPDPDLTPEALEAAMPGRPLRTYAAVVSTGAAAHGWATEGAPGGAVVIAGQQLAPRGHAARPLGHLAHQGVGFALVMRPVLPAAREGWLYTVVLSALADSLGDGSTIEWPDEVRRDGVLHAAAAVHSRIASADGGIEWAIAEVLLPNAPAPRGRLLRMVLDAIDARGAVAVEDVRHGYESVCQTIGRRVRIRMRAGTAPSVEGRATKTLADGAVVLERPDGERFAVRPQDARSCERL
jgi:BirA family biotin operon repressor/biotin-[acetyl-CoA-carboxylase] ligase